MECEGLRPLATGRRRFVEQCARQRDAEPQQPQTDRQTNTGQGRAAA